MDGHVHLPAQRLGPGAGAAQDDGDLSRSQEQLEGTGDSRQGDRRSELDPGAESQDTQLIQLDRQLDPQALTQLHPGVDPDLAVEGDRVDLVGIPTMKRRAERIWPFSLIRS